MRVFALEELLLIKPDVLLILMRNLNHLLVQVLVSDLEEKRIMIDFRSLNLLTAGSQVEKLQMIMILEKRISIAPEGIQDQLFLSKLPVGEVDLREIL